MGAVVVLIIEKLYADSIVIVFSSNLRGTVEDRADQSPLGASHRLGVVDEERQCRIGTDYLEGSLLLRRMFVLRRPQGETARG